MRRSFLFAALALGMLPSVALGQQPRGSATTSEENEPRQRLRERFGVEVAKQLLQSGGTEDHLRGIERAAQVALPLAAGPETCKGGGGDPICEEAKRALELLTPDDGQSLRSDGRSMLALARALAPFAAHTRARTALVALLNASPPSLVRGRDADGEPDLALRTALARGTAAMALAASRDPHAIDALLAVTRAGGTGQAAVVPALAAFGLSPWTPSQQPPSSPLGVSVIVQTNDLRALDLLRASAKSTESQTRSAALLAMAQMGDGRAIDLARAAIGEKDARLRSAAAEVFVLLDAGERFRAVEALIADEVTAPAGVRLAQRVQDVGVVKALAARVVATADHALRQEIVVALGRGTPLESVAVLQALAERDPSLETDIAQAYARSPSAGAMSALLKMASVPAKRRLALRAYFVRRYLRSETNDSLDAMLEAASKSKDPKDRAVGLPALVALGSVSFSSALDDPDPAVRRAVAVTALAVDAPAAHKAMLAKHAAEKDPTTRVILAGGLADGDPDGMVTTITLVDRSESGGVDAPLAALALAQRVEDDSFVKKVDALLGSPVPSVRLHAAVGVSKSSLPSAVGKLAMAWEFEVEPEVRRALVTGIAARGGASTPIGRRALELTSKLDPDGDVRSAASRVLAGLQPASAPLVREVAWLRAATSDGTAPPKGLVGTLVPKNGLAIPFAFDDEGFALVPGIPIGEASVVLGTRVAGGTP